MKKASFLLIIYLSSCTGVKQEIAIVKLQESQLTSPAAVQIGDWWKDFGDKQFSLYMEKEGMDSSKRVELAYLYASLLEKSYQRQIVEEMRANRALELSLIEIRRKNKINKKANREKIEEKIQGFDATISLLDQEIHQAMEGLFAINVDPLAFLKSKQNLQFTKSMPFQLYKGLYPMTDRTIAFIEVLEQKLQYMKNEIALHKAAHELARIRFKHGLEQFSKIYEVNEQYLLSRSRQVALSFEYKRAYIAFFATLETQNSLPSELER